MSIARLNHAVLYVRDAAKSAQFYVDALGFRVVNDMGGRAIFLQAADSQNDHDLGLFSVGDAATPSSAGRSTVGLYHLAWEVQTLTDLAEMQKTLSTAGALVGASDHSTSKSLYGRDLDGIEFEIEWMVPLDLVDQDVLDLRTTITALDIDAEIARYGADTISGTGISRTTV